MGYNSGGLALDRTTSCGATGSSEPAGPPIDHVDERVERPPAEFAEVLPHRGERRQEVRGLWDVVEPDHADVPGTRRPCSDSARSKPSAMWSLAHSTAVTLPSAAIWLPIS